MQMTCKNGGITALNSPPTGMIPPLLFAFKIRFHIMIFSHSGVFRS
jgi:hypothetical protein